MTKVFISYSHDSEPHKQFVLELSKRLCDEGLDCCIDRYINGFPPEGWQRWMEKQIEEADFVLIICTANYLKRYRGEERNGGKGVTFESVVIANTLYQNYYQNTKFIPVLPEHGSIEHVPLPLTAYSTYKLPTDYNSLYRLLTGQAEYSKPPLGSIRQLLPTKLSINSGELPTVEGELFGRSSELVLLDKALADTNTHIVQLIAAGGTGKTKLLQYWLDENKHKIEAQLIHSFYSQGSSEDKQISSTPFFIQALKALGSDKTIADFQTEEEKGEHIAELLRAKCCLLVLDGLEPLQQASPGMRGELKDRAIRRLLRQLASAHNSLCIITTRRKVHELEGRKTVHSHDLGNLAPEDGIKLLQSFGVQGREADMLAAVQEYDCHALALHLLGNAVATYLGNDIRKRDTLPELIGQYDYVEKHAFRVMQAYQHWLAGSVELKLLYLLSLFDHPVEQEVLQVLWEAHIPELTQGVTVRDWQAAQKVLIKEYRMMSAHQNQDDLFDCHPLIREYFGKQLKEKYEEVWVKAHTVLYEYYKALPEKLYGKYLPETLEEMQPLYRAVIHGCKAYKYHETLTDIYSPKIQRKNLSYLGKVLGAFNDDLVLVTSFFSHFWDELSNDIQGDSRSALFSLASDRLRASGRMYEAIKTIEKSIVVAEKEYNWQEVAKGMIALSQIQLSLGYIKDAIENSKLAIKYSNMKDHPKRLSKMLKLPLERVEALSVIIIKETEEQKIATAFTHQSSVVSLADALFQNGRLVEAEDFYNRVEIFQNETFDNHPYLTSFLGYRYCELLLEQGKSDSVLNRLEYSYKIAQENSWLSDMALDLISKGRALFKLGRISESEQTLEKAYIDLLNAGDYELIPLGAFELAILKRKKCFYLNAFSYLNELFDTANTSSMRLYLADYHLEMARLILAVEADTQQYPEATPDREHRILPFDNGECGGVLTLEQHIEKAATLIKETGYHRRDNELAELQQKAKSSL